MHLKLYINKGNCFFKIVVNKRFNQTFVLSDQNNFDLTGQSFMTFANDSLQNNFASLTIPVSTHIQTSSNATLIYCKGNVREDNGESAQFAQAHLSIHCSINFKHQNHI